MDCTPRRFLKERKLMKDIKLIFATSNENKVKEVEKLLENLNFHIQTMSEIGFTDEIPETGSTLEENSALKAQYLFDKTGLNIIAEDTGLEVKALNGDPGVYTARYAGKEKDPNQNMDLLLSNLKEKKDRSARFRTVFTLIMDGKLKSFEGISNGEIALEKKGKSGFGYDPIFIPEGYSTTFAEMSMDDKNKVSHRKRAFAKVQEYLRSLS